MNHTGTFNEYIEFQKFEDYIRIAYKNNLSVTLDGAKSIVSLRLKETDNQPHKLLIIVPLKISMEKKARDFLSGDEGLKNIIATAMVVSTKYSYFISNFFMKLNKPKIPVKIFYNEEKAIEWLTTI